MNSNHWIHLNTSMRYSLYMLHICSLLLSCIVLLAFFLQPLVLDIDSSSYTYFSITILCELIRQVKSYNIKCCFLHIANTNSLWLYGCYLYVIFKKVYFLNKTTLDLIKLSSQKIILGPQIPLVRKELGITMIEWKEAQGESPTWTWWALKRFRMLPML